MANINKKVSIINYSANSRALRPTIFFEIQKMKIFEEKKTNQFLFQFHCVHYSFPTVSSFDLLPGAKYIIFVFYMVFVRSFSQEKSLLEITLFFYNYFLHYYCSIDLKRKSEH